MLRVAGLRVYGVHRGQHGPSANLLVLDMTDRQTDRQTNRANKPPSFH